MIERGRSGVRMGRLGCSRLFAAVFLAAGVGGLAAADTPRDWPPVALDPVKMELVLQLVVTCSIPEKLGGSTPSNDGSRDEIWPIIGGHFEGEGIRGSVAPGGGDFPVVGPDGVEVVDALYRLRTDGWRDNHHS